MANDRIEQYLEAILTKLNDGTETGIPVPAWRIEEYLAAIYDKCGGGGSGGGVLVVTDTDRTLDKTWTEIHDAMLSGGAVVSFSETDTGSVVTAMYSDKEEAYVIIVCDRVGAGQFATYSASTASGYPSIE